MEHFSVDLHDKIAEYKIVGNFTNLPDYYKSADDDYEVYSDFVYSEEHYNIGSTMLIFLNIEKNKFFNSITCTRIAITAMETRIQIKLI